MTVKQEMARRTRRSFLTGGAAALLGASAWEWLRTRREDDGEPWPLRLGLRADEQISRDFFSEARLARTFKTAEAQAPKPNGKVGLDDPVPADWSLTLEGFVNSGDDVTVTMDQIHALPKTELVAELKCIEGWRTVVHWGGVRFRDFAERFGDGPFSRNAYIGMETPDGEYYVGLDLPSAMHPQTILAYEMNGAPLTAEHGAPLRLAIPVKYGIKNIKRIGKITYATARPRDYWAEDGYDWYAGF
ncbi:MAG TPA: molybdopterin-dependent oxidoreductase [Candidatus Limnocylindrales bacterium]|nr:molybdopterin-dependent oxidoreductase [Candidatus Limnocylindrales bacterium]